MSILVTGGAGYIGSHTLVRLLEQGENVVVLDSYDNSSPEALRRVMQLTGRRLEAIEGDACDTLTEAIERARETGKMILICGSLYLYADLPSALRTI